ncbi:putative homoserine kinase [Zancudomyces culisetae]|uniref:Homoserine kinase n=1 Tax=Zancudomyces culisetae TaxID=1213189 RepID=A0A1R1PL13_ZANCU|nr:putative homoserine kinase [Zancudomyces culisetae]|eukprot:OMH81646.1 putative homoserine kinase [Zancudomyces culisetae]
MSGNRFEIRVPATSANMGPGFDVIGLAVNILLKLDISLYEEVPSSAKNPGFNVEIQYSGDNSTVPLEPEKNIILVVALFILKENGFSKFPKYTKVVAENNIPLGRGMGSSAAAIVAGAILANEVGKLGFSREELLKYCLVFENHPDNITPAMVGGIVASYINHASNSDDNTATADANKGSNKSISGDSIDFVRVPYSDKIKAVTVVPQFELSTSVARSVLPTSYEKSDVKTVGTWARENCGYPEPTEYTWIAWCLLEWCWPDRPRSGDR